MNRDDFDRIYFDDVEYPIAHVKLIDALRDYIRACDDVEQDAEQARDLFNLPPMSVEDQRYHNRHRQKVTLLLKEMLEWTITPTVEMKK
jgi:hypothetical protein